MAIERVKEDDRGDWKPQGGHLSLTEILQEASLVTGYPGKAYSKLS